MKARFLAPASRRPLPLGPGLVLAISLALAPTGARLASTAHGASLMLSGNENKIDLTSGAARAVSNAAPDSLTLLDFSIFPPRIETLDGLPNTVIGPPSNIAITPNSRWALVANSVRLDPTDPARFLPESNIHLLDLASGKPRLVGEVNAGHQPSGLSITPDGRHAIVANRADGSLSLLQLREGAVSLVETVTLCRPEESISDVAIHPNGRLILASVQKGGYLAVAQLEQDRLLATPRKLSVYGQPYRVAITPDGRFGLTAGQGFGNGPDADALTVIDLEAEPARTIDYVTLGAVPESFEVSPNGRLVAAVVMAGSNLAASDPHHTRAGKLIILQRRGDRFVKTQELPVGRIPEGVAFTSDSRHLVVQCHPDRELWLFSVRGTRVRDTGQRIRVPGMPSSLRASP